MDGKQKKVREFFEVLSSLRWTREFSIEVSSISRGYSESSVHETLSNALVMLEIDPCP